MIFFDGKRRSLQNISATLEEFQHLSGLAMTKQKSALYTAGLNHLEVSSISSLGFQNGSLPFRYLGLPLMHRKFRVSEFSPLIDSLKARFSSWAVKSLTFAGRMQLISSVIYSTLTFWLSAFTIPKGCIKIIDQLCNSFLWSGSTTYHATAKVSWEKVCLPKSEGGLG